MAEGREEIKGRMLQNAAAMWGLPGTENENAFDPVVSMLFNACAAELEKIGRDSKTSSFRLLEQLGEILVPEIEANALPAHAICYAYPTEQKTLIAETHQFAVDYKHEQFEEKSRFYFSPAGKFPLQKLKVKYLATTGFIDEFSESNYKRNMAKTRVPARQGGNSLWIGFECDALLKNTGEISLYFELRNQQQADFFFYQLKRATIYMNGRACNTSGGYADSENKRSEPEEVLNYRFHTAHDTNKHVLNYYERQFLTFKPSADFDTLKSRFPLELKELFDENALQKLPAETCWLEVRFPEQVNNLSFTDLYCRFNCFPVLNRKLNSFIFRLQNTLNIIPLFAGEYFFDIHSVTDTSGNAYHILSDKTDDESPEMILRNKGVGRFRGKDAQESIYDLIEAMRDESAAFAALGGDSVNRSLKELNRILVNLEDKVSSVSQKEGITYLMFRNVTKEFKNLFVDFWSTKGAEGNFIKAGTKLDSVSGIDLANKSGELLSPTFGGRSRLNDQDRLAVFKTAFTTRGRLVTQEDIRTYCHQLFGDRINHVQISKGLAVHPGAKSGLVRTIRITLKTNPEWSTSHEEWQYLVHELKTTLHERSSAVFPFDINIES